MTEESPVAHLANMQVTTNAESAPVEQQSTETTPEPAATETVVTETPATEPAKVESAPETKPEPAKAEPQIDEKENARARELMEARIRADKAEGELKALKPAEKPLGDRPKIENFDTLENYDKAVDEWNDRRVDAAANKVATDKIAADKNANIARQDEINVATKVEASRVKHPDFYAVVGPLKPIIESSPLLQDFIKKNPMGTEVVYELGKNPALLEQLTRLDVWGAGEQLLSMAARLKTPVTVKPTNAPEPIKPVGTNESAKVKMSTLPIGDYFAARKAQELKLRHLN